MWPLDHMTDKNSTLEINMYHTHWFFWQKHDSNSSVLHAWSSVSNLFYYYYFYCLEVMSHSLGQKKNLNNKISISQFNVSPCQNIFLVSYGYFLVSQTSLQLWFHIAMDFPSYKNKTASLIHSCTTVLPGSTPVNHLQIKLQFLNKLICLFFRDF